METVVVATFDCGLDRVSTDTASPAPPDELPRQQVLGNIYLCSCHLDIRETHLPSRPGTPTALMLSDQADSWPIY